MTKLYFTPITPKECLPHNAGGVLRRLRVLREYLWREKEFLRQLPLPRELAVAIALTEDTALIISMLDSFLRDLPPSSEPTATTNGEELPQ